MTSRLKVKLAYIPLILWAVVILFPLYWVAITSVKLPLDINRGATYLPWVDFQPDTHAWKEIFSGQVQLLKPLWNSTIASAASALLSTALGALAAYGLTRFRYRWGPWRNQEIAFWFISQRMMPPVATVLAFLIMFKYLRLLDSVTGLVLAYTAFNLSFAVWMLRDFFRGIPEELEESAMVEGCTRFQALRLITVPLVTPGLVATLIFCFIFSWNEYLFAVVLTFERSGTLPLLLAGQATAVGVRWWQMSALTLISLVPSVVLGLAVQRYIVRGLTAGAIK